MIAVVTTAVAVLGIGQGASLPVPPKSPAVSPAPTGPTPARGSTALASAADTFGPLSDMSELPQISADGNWTVFDTDSYGCLSDCAYQPADPLTENSDQFRVLARNSDPNAPDLHRTVQISIGSTFSPTLPAGSIVSPDGTDPDSYSDHASISADGRYVSFLTYASNVVPVNNGPGESLVVCDRDPSGTKDANGNWVLDTVTTVNGTRTRDYKCRAVFSPTSGSGTIDYQYTPRLSSDGSSIAWTFASDSVGHDIVQVAKVSDANGLLANPATPVTVSGIVADATNFDPSITSDNNYVVMTSVKPSGFNTIVRTDISNPASQTVVRVDTDLDGTGYLGDHTYTGPFCTDPSGCPVIIDTPHTSNDGKTVLFHYNNAFDRLVLVRNVGAANQASEIVSLSNDGSLVDTALGTISGNGRFLVFEEDDADASDGTINQQGGGDELVARDLVLDRQRASAGLPRLPGALVTADANSDCTPQPPALYCESGSGFSEFNTISVSDNGARAAFDTGYNDLIPGDASTTGDTNGEEDIYVRTWQPVLSSTAVNAGNVTIGTPVTRQIAVTVDGFGPVQLGPTSVNGSNDVTPGATTCDNAVLFTGGQCTVAVTISPQGPGSQTATVQVDSPQYDSPQDVASVTFNGVETGAAFADADNVRTSVRDNGAQSPTGGSQGMISGNGRWQVFVSDSDLTNRTPIVPVDYPIQNVFVRDLADPQHTLQISLHTKIAGAPNSPSRPIEVKGHPTGASPNSDSYLPSISADGRFVSFITAATDIVPPKWFNNVPPDVTGLTVVVCDRDPDGNGVFDEVVPGTQVPNYKCWPVETDWGQSSRILDDSVTPVLSGDGTRIAYSVEPAQDVDGDRVFISSLSAPGAAMHTPTAPALVPIKLPGTPFTDTTKASFSCYDAWQFNPRLNYDGSQVVFNAVPGDCNESNAQAILRVTLATGLTVRFDTLDGGASFLGDNSGSFGAPAITDAGNRVAFAYQDRAAQFAEVYVATLIGTTVNTVIESRDNNGRPSAGTAPALSGDGRYLAFETSRPLESNAIDPLNGDCGDNGEFGFYCQIVARDLVKDAAFFAGSQTWTPSEIVSSSIFTNCAAQVPAGRKCAGAGNSSNPSIDQTGSEIGFDSRAQDIVAGDNDAGCGGECAGTDTFVHTWRPTLSATPSFNLGTVLVGGHRNRTYTVTESGFGPISVAGATVTGTNPSDFAVVTDNCAGLTLNDGDTCTFKLRFTPSAAGPRSANLAYPVAKNGYPRVRPDGTATDPALLAGLTGLGVGGGGLTPQPTTLDFGPQLPLAPGTTSTVTLTNTGGGPVTITDVTVQDTTVPGASGDYTVNATDCLGVLQVGQSCVVQVTFVGHKTGDRGAQLLVTDDTSPTPTTVVLVAKVPKPKTLINPGVVQPGGVTTVFGTGFAPNRLVDITLKGFSEQVTVRANAKGKFEVGLVIFHNTPEGGQLVVAHSHGADKSIGKTNPLLITLGTIDDLGLVTRH